MSGSPQVHQRYVRRMPAISGHRFAATVGARWMQPSAVLTGRALRFNVQFDF
jgi:hypothetical protein